MQWKLFGAANLHIQTLLLESNTSNSELSNMIVGEVLIWKDRVIPLPCIIVGEEDKA